MITNDVKLSRRWTGSIYIPQRFRCSVYEDHGAFVVRTNYYFATEAAAVAHGEKNAWVTGGAYAVFDRKRRRYVRRVTP